MSIKLGNTDINKVYLGSTEVTKVYLGNTIVYDGNSLTNLILNSTFDNEDDVAFSGDFSITGGEGVYTHTAGSATFTWDLSEDMVADSSYNFTMDILNLVSGNARFRFFVNQGGSFVEVLGNTNYNSGVDVNLTAPSGANSTQLRIITSSAASSFDFDNAVLTQN